MLIDKEHERNTEIYTAARPERPPKPYFKEKPKGKQAPKLSTSEKANTRSHLKGIGWNLGQQPIQPMYQCEIYKQSQQFTQLVYASAQPQPIQLNEDLPT